MSHDSFIAHKRGAKTQTPQIPPHTKKEKRKEKTLASGKQVGRKRHDSWVIQSISDGAQFHRPYQLCKIKLEQLNGNCHSLDDLSHDLDQVGTHLLKYNTIKIVFKR